MKAFEVIAKYNDLYVTNGDWTFKIAEVTFEQSDLEMEVVESAFTNCGDAWNKPSDVYNFTALDKSFMLTRVVARTTPIAG